MTATLAKGMIFMVIVLILAFAPTWGCYIKTMKNKSTGQFFSVAAAPKGRSRGSNQVGVRLYNERLALSLIRQQGNLPKAEIARQTGLSPQTISVILKQLESAGLVRKEKPLRGRVGQPRVPFSLNPDGAYSFGLKIGRRSSDLILMDFVGNVKQLIRETYPYPTPDNIKTFVGNGVETLKGNLKKSLWPRISGIGVGCPYELWNWGEEVGAPDGVMDQWKSFDIGEEIEAVTGLPTSSCNDATGACAAELVFGNPNDFQNFLYFFIGTFIGGGVVLGGDLFTGPQGNAGAIGPIPIQATDGSGQIRQLIGAASIYTLEKRLAAEGKDPAIIWRMPDSWNNLGAVVDVWIDEVSAAIAYAMISAMSVIDFEAIVIDGAFPPEVRSRILSGTSKALEELDRQGVSRFALAEGILGGNAWAIGGACLPLLSNFAPDSDVLLKDVG